MDILAEVLVLNKQTWHLHLDCGKRSDNVNIIITLSLYHLPN